MYFEPVVEIIRLEEDFQYGTFGVMRIQKKIFCATLEPPDIENQRNISSIPAQQYKCSAHISGRFGPTYEILDVPGRSAVLFHPGNTDQDTQGCILLGETWGTLGSERAILSSRKAFQDFMVKLDEAPYFHLTIKEVY